MKSLFLFLLLFRLSFGSVDYEIKAHGFTPERKYIIESDSAKNRSLIRGYSSQRKWHKANWKIKEHQAWKSNVDGLIWTVRFAEQSKEKAACKDGVEVKSRFETTFICPSQTQSFFTIVQLLSDLDSKLQ